MVGFSKGKLKAKGLSFKNTYLGLGTLISRRVFGFHETLVSGSSMERKQKPYLPNKVNNADFLACGFLCPGFRKGGVGDRFRCHRLVSQSLCG